MSGRFESLLLRVDDTIGKVDGNLDNITKLTEALGEDGPEFVSALLSAAQEFDASMAQLSEFARSLNNPDGSFGQLLNDPEFFQTVSSTVKNADQTIKNIQRITVQLQPILKDFNVFSNKLAREPGLLGLKGVFDKSPPTKGIPDAYANPWQFGRNNGIPQQQSERIQLIRTPQWPLGAQQYRNEPVPVQNHYASQVIDLPDVSPYDDLTSNVRFRDSDSVNDRPVSQVVPRDRVVIVPVQAQVPAQVPVQAPMPAVQHIEPAWTQPARTQTAISGTQSATLEIDFTPNALEQQMTNPSPLRLVSGNTSVAPPITQPLHGNIEPTVTPAIQPVWTTSPTKEKRSEIEIPSFTPCF